MIDDNISEILDFFGKDAVNKIFSSPNCDVVSDFLGYLKVYEPLKNIPRDMIILDVGCGYAFQSYYFKDHKEYIGIEPSIPEVYIAHTNNSRFFNLSFQDWIAVPDNKLWVEKNKDSILAVCSAVPDTVCQGMVADYFKYFVISYPEQGVFQNLPACCCIE